MTSVYKAVHMLSIDLDQATNLIGEVLQCRLDAFHAFNSSGLGWTVNQAEYLFVGAFPVFDVIGSVHMRC